MLIEEGQPSNPVDVIHHFHSALVSDKEKYSFELIAARPLRSYVEVTSHMNPTVLFDADRVVSLSLVQAKQESFHVCYTFKKIARTDEHSTFQDFLDQQQYSRNGVLRYEKIFGPGFVSTGGLDTTKVRSSPSACAHAACFTCVDKPWHV